MIPEIPSRESHERRLMAELDQVSRQLATMGIQKAILFGSLSRGDVTIFSDIDLIIVQETDARFLDRLDPFYTQLDLGVDVDILVYTPDELADMATWNPLVRQALQEGKVIYEADSS
jgi:predicted nucleotidyltransferase